MPALAGRPDERADPAALDLLAGGVEHRGLDRAPLAVEPVEPLGQRRGLVRVSRGQQAHAEVGGADPPAGVDARADGVAEIARAGRRGEARDIGQRGQSRALAAGQHGQALAHEGAVQPGQRRHVSDGRHGDEVEQAQQVGLGPVAEELLGAHQPVGGDQQQEDHARGAEMAEARAVLGAVRIDDDRVRQLGPRQVVVDDDDVRARRARGGDGAERQGAAVDADDEVVRPPELGHRRHVRAIALVDAVGDVERRLAPERPQPVDQQRRRGGAVDVVVAEDGDALPAGGGLGQPAGRPVHVGQRRGVGHQRAKRRRHVGVDALGGDPVGGEQARDDIGQAGGLRQPERRALDVRARPAPAPARQRAGDAQIWGFGNHRPRYTGTRRGAEAGRVDLPHWEGRAMDWDDAYANAPHIPGAEAYPPRWAREAAAFRAALGARARVGMGYGEAPAERLDLFMPEGAPRGLMVFVHGGYWQRFGRQDWSHLAAGGLARGWAVAMPGYTLCPGIRVAGITRQVGAAVMRAAAVVAGPIRLAGHSAGGHLVSRMLCADAPLPAAVAARIEHSVSISGVHDLRPLLRTRLNEALRLDGSEARAESPALLDPREGVRLTAWVGADERPEFVRQNALLANIWTGLGAATRAVVEPGRHHFDVIEGLAAPDSPLMGDLLG